MEAAQSDELAELQACHAAVAPERRPLAALGACGIANAVLQLSFLACSPPYQPALCQLEFSHFWSATTPFQARHFILQAFNLLALTRFPALPPHNGFPLACPPRIHLQHWLLLKFF